MEVIEYLSRLLNFASQSPPNTPSPPESAPLIAPTTPTPPTQTGLTPAPATPGLRSHNSRNPGARAIGTASTW
ncbi:MAG: hypothetical protein SW833_08565 [Cyanobacteriota bacterium]|nr:hypothetical protein [Cyanobacteriota bacterium]